MNILVLLIISASLLFAAPVSARELAEDEQGLLMIVEDHERYIRTSPLRIKDEELDGYLNDLACQVAPADCSEIRVYALMLPGFNAFMMANGAMFIQSGLLLRMESESELASVIGHEIAHYKESHSIENIRRWRKTGNAFAVIGAIVSAAGTVSVNSADSYESAARNLDISNTAIAMLETAKIFAAFQLIAYGRDDEREADEIGLHYIQNAGFNPEASAAVWEKYLAEHEAGKGQGGFSMLATHPTPEARFDRLSELAGALPQETDRSDVESQPFFTMLARFRKDWMESEAQSLHPEQFEALAERQATVTNLSPGYLAYLQANAWERYSEKQMLGRRKQKNALEVALEHYRSGAKTESGLPTAAYRDWGRLSKSFGQEEEARAAIQKYLELAPDAWDAKFLRRELEQDGQ